jgi:hypothetical protein
MAGRKVNPKGVGIFVDFRRILLMREPPCVTNFLSSLTYALIKILKLKK